MKRTREEAGRESHNPRSTNEALQYLKDVKAKFHDNNEKYEEFLGVMREFKAQKIDANGVTKIVQELFKGHNQLIIGFNAFLPEGCKIVIEEPHCKKQKVQFDQAIQFVNKIKARFQIPVYKAFLEILNKYRNGSKPIVDVYEEVTALFRDEEDLLNEFTLFLPDNSLELLKAPRSRKEDKSARQNVKKERDSDRENGKAEKERKKDRDRRDDRDRDEYERETDAEGAPRHKEKRQSARRAHELIRKQSQAGDAAGHAIFDKIKARMRNRESYQDLLRVMNLYTEQIISRSELRALVHDVLGQHQDLWDAFNDLFVRGDNEVESEGGPIKTAKTERDDEKDNWEERDRDKDKDRERYPSKDRMTLLPCKDKYANKSVAELDLSECERCTPSYRLLPKNYPRAISSYRNALANSVLNDDWVSVTLGSEEHFQHTKRNQHEETLFRCEDDRFELDILLESTKSAAKYVERYIDELQEAEVQPLFEDMLSAMHLRCIERIYGDHGLETIDRLRQEPGVVLPVIHNRLAQKIKEWTKARAEMNKAWAEVYAKNYHKSLDRRSFSFKHEDKKSIGAKALINEIKTIHQKKVAEDDHILLSVMGNKRVLTPHMKFGFPDASVHEDLFQIMKFSADEVCSTSEQSDKVKRIWTTFVEPMFNVPSRPTRGPEEAGKTQPDAHRTSTSGESAASGATPNGDAGKDTASSKPETSRRDRMEEVGTSGGSGDSGRHQDGSKVDDGSVLQGSQEPRFRDNNSRTEIDLKGSAGKSEKPDLEEGELSPSPDLDDGQNGTSKVRSGKSRKEEDGEAEVEAEHDDADDEGEESAHKYSEDSENASEQGDEGSGSESQDEGSRDHEAEEDGDDDREDKAESECEAEGMADADDGEAADRSSLLCKPLGRLTNGSNTFKNSKIFYGNDMFYILVRLHQKLYDRIYSAKTNAIANEQRWRATKGTTPPNLYEKFLRLLHDLLDGSADNAKFEDECRAIIGNQSYVLFTLDLLIFKIVKQIEAIAGDETANKLLQLNSYEMSRAPNDFSDSGYHANACVLLHKENSEKGSQSNTDSHSIYRFEHNLDDCESTIQLMDGNPEVPASAMDFRFSNYLSDFLLNVPGPETTKVDDPSAEQVYLLRNKDIYSATDECGALMDAMKNVHVFNGLEHKISCKDSKVSYVLDTEDLFHRRKQRPAAAPGTPEERKRKFQEWTDNRLRSLS